MALFSRVNSNVFSLLSHCYYKKYTMGTGRLRLRGRTSMLLNVQYKSSTRSVQTTLETEIIQRRDQARRSLLIQVYSPKSHNDLYNYCSRFGDILSMHHYQVNRNHYQENYILVEFKDVVSVDGIMSYASFVRSDYIAPVKSSVLWFRKGQVAISQKNQTKVALTVEHGYIYINDKKILNVLSNAKSISGQIIILYETLRLTDLEIRLRFHTAQHLEQYFSGLFHNMRVLPFGSSINGFGRRKCDLDLVLVPDYSQEGNSRLVFHSKPIRHNDRNETKEFLGILANAMYQFIPGISNVRRILEARVPIIKFHYDYTQIECDLSATNMTAVYMSELLNLYGEMDWRVRPLVTAIRVWAKRQEITADVPGQWITNFPLTLLVLFYLQQKEILPSLKILKLHAARGDVRCTENGIDCTFLRDINKLPADFKYKLNQDSLETLLHDFFEYYSTFNFDIYGICIREGRQIQKPSHTALHITNPLETTLNVGKNVSFYELNRIISKAQDAVHTLETADKTNEDNWGIMTLLKINNVNTKSLKKLNNTKESEIIKNYLENRSYEISDKFDVSEENTNEPKTKKEEIV
ncbi:hypothetical protein P5V15_007555 [Pogonomyrmex californicus]